jgi:hypothetical protein
MPCLPVHVVVVGVPVFGRAQQGMATLLVHRSVQEFKAQEGDVQARYGDQAQRPSQQRQIHRQSGQPGGDNNMGGSVQVLWIQWFLMVFGVCVRHKAMKHKAVHQVLDQCPRRHATCKSTNELPGRDRRPRRGRPGQRQSGQQTQRRGRAIVQQHAACTGRTPPPRRWAARYRRLSRNQFGLHGVTVVGLAVRPVAVLHCIPLGGHRAVAPWTRGGRWGSLRHPARELRQASPVLVL